MVALLAAATLTAASAIGATLPASQELPPNMVAFVSRVTVSEGRLTAAEFQRGLEQQAAFAGRHSAPEPGGRGYRKLRDAALGELLDSIWIKGQASEMGIVVTRGQVAIELAVIKRANFKNEAQYHRFLKESHFTRRDVNERVELQLLSTRIQERVARGTTSAGDAQAKFKQFVDAYSTRWRARTVCAAEFAIDRCSNGPPPS